MHHNLVNSNFRRLSALTLGDRSPVGSSNNETEVCNSSGQLVFEYFERDQPHVRPPIYDKAGPFPFEIFALEFLLYFPIFCPYFDTCYLFSPSGH